MIITAKTEITNEVIEHYQGQDLTDIIKRDVIINVVEKFAESDLRIELKKTKKDYSVEYEGSFIILNKGMKDTLYNFLQNKLTREDYIKFLDLINAE